MKLRKFESCSFVSAVLTAIVVLVSAVTSASAQITYVDATEGLAGNTTLLDGSVFNTVANSTQPPDDLWSVRDFANGGNVFEASVSSPSGIEDAPMLATTITGLTPGTNYYTYGYFWATTTPWRLEATIDPADIDDSGTPGDITDDSLLPVPKVSFSHNGQPNTTTAPAAVVDDFVVAPLVEESTRTMYQASLGVTVADGSGEIVVYIDDWENEDNFRTWYDGVGYAEAPSLSLEVDVATGALELVNASGSQEIIGYSISSESGSLVQAGWDTVADGDSSWTVLSNPASKSDLSEFKTTSGTGVEVTPGSPLTFSTAGAYLDSPFRDIELEVIYPSGVISIPVNYSGDAPIVGDLDLDGDVDIEGDYNIFISNMHSDLSSMTLAESYLLGDMNEDMASDFTDLNLFIAAFDDANGAGAFAAATSAVPEPSSAILFGLGGVFLFGLRRSRKSSQGIVGEVDDSVQADLTSRFQAARALTACCLGLVFALMAASTSLAQITYVDATDGAGGNTTLLDGADWTAVAAGAADDLWRERAFANGGTIFETNASGSEDAHMLITSASGLVPGNAYNMYGYFWASGSNWRLKATLDSDDINDNGTPGDVEDDFLANDPSVAFSAFGSGTSTTASGADALDFTVAPLVAEGNRALYQASLGIAVADTNGDIPVYIDDLEDQTSSNFRTWYDGIGYERIQFALEVNTTTGATRIVNVGGSPGEINYYEITSSSPSLSLAGWSSLDEQDLDAVDGADVGTDAGDSVGEGWDAAGGSGSTLLSEYFFSDTSMVADQQALSLGEAFNSATGTISDLGFSFSRGDGRLQEGLVNVVLAGDMNGDGTVDDTDVNPFVQALTRRADYETAFPGLDADFVGDFNGNGSLDLGDVADFKLAVAASSAGQFSAVPEPSALTLLGLSLLGWVTIRRRTQSK